MTGCNHSLRGTRVNNNNSKWINPTGRLRARGTAQAFWSLRGMQLCKNNARALVLSFQIDCRMCILNADEYMNYRLTFVLLRYFCNTRPPKGGTPLLQPLPGFSIRNAWYPYICYQCMELFYSLIPKWVQLNFIWRHCDVIKSARPRKFWCFENIRENEQKSIFC